MKKNEDIHPQRLPSIQSTFPVFVIDDPSKVTNLLNDKKNDINPISSNKTKKSDSISTENFKSNYVSSILNVNNYSEPKFENETIKSENSFLKSINSNHTNSIFFEKGQDSTNNIFNIQKNGLNSNSYNPLSNKQEKSFTSPQPVQLFIYDKKIINNPQKKNFVKTESLSLDSEESKNEENEKTEDLQKNSNFSYSDDEYFEPEKQSKSKSSNYSREKSTKSKINTTKSITIDPNKLGFLPRDFWIRSNLLTLDQIKKDFFRARSSKSLRFEFKLWNALAITKNYPSLFNEIGVKWVARVLIMVHRDVFGKLLNVSRPSAALFSSCGAFMTHGFIEVSLKEAKQRLIMMSMKSQALPNNQFGSNNVFYQNHFYYGPNMYSNVNYLPIQNQQLQIISNSSSNLNSFNTSLYSYPNQSIQSDPSIASSLKTVPDIDIELPSEIDESIIRLFTHKTGEFTEDSHANEIIKCKWSNESRSPIKNFKI